MHPTYGTDREECWVEPGCTHCEGCPEHKLVEVCQAKGCDRAQPCSPACEGMAVRGARVRRIITRAEENIASYERRLLRCHDVLATYRAEAVPGDARIVAVVEQIAEYRRIVADYDRQIHEAVMAQERDDAGEAETLPAPGMPECDQDA